MKQLCLTETCLLLLTSTSYAQKSIINKKDTTAFEYTVEAAPEWTSFFYRKSGWFGADKNNHEGNDPSSP